jgi:hypothetical protein
VPRNFISPRKLHQRLAEASVSKNGSSTAPHRPRHDGVLEIEKVLA